MCEDPGAPVTASRKSSLGVDVTLALAFALASSTTACGGCSKTDSTAKSDSGPALSVTSIGMPGTDASVATDRPDASHSPSSMLTDACAGKTEGEVCTVTMRDKSIVGACTMTRPGTDDPRPFCRIGRPHFFGNRPHGLGSAPLP